MPHSTIPDQQPPAPPALPIELWMHILSSASDDTEALPHLWFAARATSRLLRAATEAAFPLAHLRRWLHLCSFKIPRAALAFHRLAEHDRGRAVLRAQPWRGFEDRPGTPSNAAGQFGAEGQRRLEEGVAREWEEVLGEGTERGFGDYMVCLRGVVQDTEVAGWKVVSGEGDEVFEVEVEWKGMLDKLFGEELRARRRGEILARRFKRDREDKWAVYGPEVINDQLHFRTFEAVLLGNENHRAYQNGYRDARRLRIERWIEKVEKDPKKAYALRKKQIDAEWVPNFRMNAVRERLEKKMVEWGEERYPQPSVIRKRLLESDVPMKRELCTLDDELVAEEKEEERGHDDEADLERYAEIGLLWKGRTSEEVEKMMRIRAFTAELDHYHPASVEHAKVDPGHSKHDA